MSSSNYTLPETNSLIYPLKVDQWKEETPRNYSNHFQTFKGFHSLTVSVKTREDNLSHEIHSKPQGEGDSNQIRIALAPANKSGGEFVALASIGIVSQPTRGDLWNFTSRGGKRESFNGWLTTSQPDLPPLTVPQIAGLVSTGQLFEPFGFP